MKTFKKFLEQKVDSGAYRYLPSNASWVNNYIINDAKNKKTKNDSFFYKFDVKSK
jgi:hypothetical protein